jgi:ABC-type transport system substrate-binding protein
MPPNGENVSFYADPEIGRLVKAGLATYDAGARHDAYDRIQHILIREVPEYVLDWLPEVVAFNSDLHGIEPVPVGSDLWNIGSWTLGPSAANVTPTP